MSEPNNNEAIQTFTFDKIRISLASPEKIRSWSRRPYMTNPDDGEVKKPETINYRTLKPEKDGLFCEKIFGPSKDWECHCGKYKKIRYKGVVCDRCGVEVTKSSVRRERMGRIELAAPVSHIWYFKGIPSRMGLMLELTPKALEKVLYFASYIVLKPGNSGLAYKQVINEGEYREGLRKQDLYRRILNDDPDAIRRQEENKILSDAEFKDAKEKKIDNGNLEVGMGAEAIQKLLAEINLEEESAKLHAELKDAKGQKAAKIVKKLEAVEAFRNSGNRPEWMILDVIPVIPPDLRPMVQLDGGRFATSDLNDLYRRILNRNNRLQRLKELAAPDIIVRNEKRMLQEAVDALIDNGRRGRPVTGPGNRALKSLSDMLKGKQGRFRQNLLGKRVDYSGRSVIVVGPELKIYQCGLPKEMAIELFKPFVMKELQANGKAPNIKAAKKMVERLQPEVWDVLEEVIHEHPVMLNRAPTLHRLGIQAFEPILVEGKAIKLHPLVCTAFNADFDGDQMAVHLPLSVEAQSECRFMLLSPNNLLKPSDGGPVAVPTQDMVLGIYYLTQEREPEKTYGSGKYFTSKNEAILAYENGYISLHARIHVRRSVVTPEGKTVTGTIETTLGRLLFNEIIPQDLGFVERKCDEDYLKLEIDFHVGKKHIKQILEKVINVHGSTRTAEVLDDIKAIGYKYSTRAAMTVSISDMTVPPQKKDILDAAQARVEQISKNYRRGFVTEEERYNEVINTWKAADAEITSALLNGLDKYNNIFMMADSGARGSDKQIKQLAGMRGLMADTTGRTIELPIKSNFREGLDVLEYFISAHGARKGLSDTALRTADSGYLTRRLVDVSQDLIIRETDCSSGTNDIPYMEIRAVTDGKEVIESLDQRISGRYAAEDIVDEDGVLLVGANEMISPQAAVQITKTGRESVKIRTVLSCRSRQGVCAKCYGANMATGHDVQVGEAVGIIAAQSIGEPGTQLTMRTFHTGGVAGDDITQGLPRVEELFEARKPKGVAIIAEFGGKVELRDGAKGREIVVDNPDYQDAKPYQIPFNSRIKVKNGDIVEAGDELTEGSINPHDLLRIKGVRAVQDYMIREVQRVYRIQGVEINDKHIEVIVRQMLKKVKVETAGDTGFLPGTSVDVLDFQAENRRILEENERRAAEYAETGIYGESGIPVVGEIDWRKVNEQVAEENSRLMDEDKKLPDEEKRPLIKKPFLDPADGKQVMLGITKASLATNSFLSAASFQETTKVLTEAAINGKVDPLIGLKENVIIGKLIPAGTGMKQYRQVRLNSDAAGFDVPEIPDDGSISSLSEGDADTAEDTAAAAKAGAGPQSVEADVFGGDSSAGLIDFSEESEESADAGSENAQASAKAADGAADAEADAAGQLSAAADGTSETAGSEPVTLDLSKLKNAVAKVMDLEKKKDQMPQTDSASQKVSTGAVLDDDDDDDFEPEEDQYVDLSSSMGRDFDDIIDSAAHADDYGDGRTDET